MGKKVAIITDSNSGITALQAKELGVYLLPMPFYINDELFFEEITLSQDEFYKKLAENATISTSQPAPGDVMDIWKKALEENDELVYIPMSSGLSKSCETAMMLAKNFEGFDGKVFVADNQRISVTQRQSVIDAVDLAKTGKSAEEIRDILVRDKFKSSIYIMVDTLKYLKKGGRITPAAAAVGSVLNIKPVLQIQGEKLDAFAKVRGKAKGLKTMLEAMHKDFDTRFSHVPAEKMRLAIAYSGAYDDAVKAWQEAVAKDFPMCEVYMDKLSLSVSCHIGPGALAIAVSEPIPELCR